MGRVVGVIDGESSDGSVGVRGWAPAHSWRWFLVRSARHVPKATRNEPQWKSLGASFFSVLQAIGQAANEDGTNAFLGTDTLMAVGRCSKETVHKVLVAAEAVGLIMKTAKARGGRYPKPATYACTLPLGADAATGRGLDWEQALAVLSSSEDDRRLRHKRAKATERHVTPPGQGLENGQEASHDPAWGSEGRVQGASRDGFTGRHVTSQEASRDAPTRFHPAFHHETAEVVDPPQVDGCLLVEQDQHSLSPEFEDELPMKQQAVPPQSRSRAAANHERHVATCERCSREMWCPQGASLRRYLTIGQSRKRAEHMGRNEAPSP